MIAPAILPATQRHVFSVLVDDEPGILARVVGLFSGRGYNIESLTVANVNSEKGMSRITIVSCGTAQVLEQIEAQLNRLVPVRKVVNLTRQGPMLEREMALLKVTNAGEQRIEMLRIADVFHARPVDATTSSFIFEINGTAEEINNFAALMAPLGLVEVVRSGVLGIARGTDAI
jgi:acetolactate synthase-1/3 small subunit